jgi:hypothetical protein
MHKSFKVGRNLEPTDLLVGGIIWGEGGREVGWCANIKNE